MIYGTPASALEGKTSPQFKKGIAGENRVYEYLGSKGVLDKSLSFWSMKLRSPKLGDLDLLLFDTRNEVAYLVDIKNWSNIDQVRLWNNTFTLGEEYEPFPVSRTIETLSYQMKNWEPFKQTKYMLQEVILFTGNLTRESRNIFSAAWPTSHILSMSEFSEGLDAVLPKKSLKGIPSQLRPITDSLMDSVCVQSVQYSFQGPEQTYLKFSI